MEVTLVAMTTLHARPAAQFVRAVLDSGGDAWIRRPGQVATDARSIVSVLALDIRCGEQVIIGSHNENLLRHLSELLT